MKAKASSTTLQRAVPRRAAIMAGEQYEQDHEDQEDPEDLHEGELDPLHASEDGELGEPTSAGDEGVMSPHDREWLGRHPVPSQLPRRARPPVLFHIDHNGAVRTVVKGKDSFQPLRVAITGAIALHLEQSSVRLSEHGDWVQIPAIGKESNLLELIKQRMLAAGEAGVESFIDDLRGHLKSRGSLLKLFGIRLPSGDVVVPAALMRPAKVGKRASYCAVIRFAAGDSKELPAMIAGEEWTEQDWRDFRRQYRDRIKKAERKQPIGHAD